MQMPTVCPLILQTNFSWKYLRNYASYHCMVFQPPFRNFVATGTITLCRSDQRLLKYSMTSQFVSLQNKWIQCKSILIWSRLQFRNTCTFELLHHQQEYQPDLCIKLDLLSIVKYTCIYISSNDPFTLANNISNRVA